MGMVVHTCNLSTQKDDAEGNMQVWSQYTISCGQPELQVSFEALYSETLSQRKKKKHTHKK